MEFYSEALKAFTNNFQNFSVQPLDGGLINHSFKITDSNTGERLLLQRINHHVFKKPEDVQLNYQLLWKHLKSSDADIRIPEPKYFPGDVDLYWDSNHNFWRVVEFIDVGEMFSNAETPGQARETAKTFAAFTAAFYDFDVSQLKDTIPDFHNLSFRFHQFTDSLSTQLTERKQKAAELITQLQQRKKYVDLYATFQSSADYPKRVMHHDAKIANILFSKTNGKVICPVDFDTTMPGYFFSDLGDMIRSMACSHDEGSTDFKNISIRKEFYENIHYAGIIIIYMQALRFMTDYLNGDIYYKTNYPEQNFDRAKNQLTLLQSLEQMLNNRKEI
jgi:thiamine kinase-like enzyme